MLTLMQCPSCGHVWARKNTRSDLDDAVLGRQYRDGATLRQLARLHGCAYSTVRKRLVNAGEKLRPRSRRAAPDGVR